MESSVLSDTPENELLEMLSNEKQNLYKMKMSHEVSPLENPKLLTMKRKVIARIKTEISKRKIKSKK